jgi:5-methyltetrahydropteroyltriglutamate--homocysteine methyltransferase
MKRSVERILTTHVGSLPRPADLIEAWRREPPESDALAATLRRAVRDIVRQQADAGLDVLNDGEFGKPVQDAVDYGAWMKYVGSRMSGFDLRMGETDMFPGKDRADFNEFYRGQAVETGEIRPCEVVCTGPIRYTVTLRSSVTSKTCAPRAAESASTMSSCRSCRPQASSRCSPTSTTRRRRNTRGLWPPP